MYILKSKSKNAVSYYCYKTIYDENKKKKNIRVANLGTHADISKEHSDVDAYLKMRVAEIEIEEAEKERKEEDVLVPFNPSKTIDFNEQNLFNCSYLFLQSIYYELGIDKICKDIEKRYNNKFDINEILSRLIYSRILFPCSKLKTIEESKKYIEQSSFTHQQVLRCMDILDKENDFIQSKVFKYSEKMMNRNTQVLYYDCTNYFFEIEEEDGFRMYANSKENRPNPIVEMGLFIDGDGIPMAFSIHSGNTSEQITLKPLEEKIIKNYGKKKFIVCTDCGLSSAGNRLFNSKGMRDFITVQTLKKIKANIGKWALSPIGWKAKGIKGTVNLNDILNSDELSEKYYKTIFYKEEWYIDDETKLSQRYVSTFSIKYRNYLKSIRSKRIERAEKKIKDNNVDRKKENDPNRYIARVDTTKEGEVAVNKEYIINDNQISIDESYDGFYCIATSLEGDIEEIISINKQRWQIEACFRLMKHDFKARPINHRLPERINAHFLTCYLSLLIFKILETKTYNQFTESQLLDTLRDMNLLKIKDKGFIPAYKRTDITEELHKAFKFRTDYEITDFKKMKKIFKQTKKAEH